MSRYEIMFETLARKNQIAFIPFTVLGFPNFDGCLKIIETLIDNGADALELGIPFSDPSADGPTIQKANNVALKAGIVPVECFRLIERVRNRYPDIPIGLLVYANLVIGPGADVFFKKCSDVGVDSVLVADIPLAERKTVAPYAASNNIELVHMLPPNADNSTLRDVARYSGGYVYLLSRAGVTGTEKAADLPLDHLVKGLKQFGAARSVLGFGVRGPSDIVSARNAGVEGVISGSAILEILLASDLKTSLPILGEFIAKMKAATITSKQIVAAHA